MDHWLVDRMDNVVAAVQQQAAELAAADELITVLRAECDQLEVDKQHLTAENSRLRARLAKALRTPAAGWVA